MLWTRFQQYGKLIYLEKLETIYWKIRNYLQYWGENLNPWADKKIRSLETEIENLENNQVAILMIWETKDLWGVC